jgi:lipoyl(octanoyl) transferase
LIPLGKKNESSIEVLNFLPWTGKQNYQAIWDFQKKRLEEIASGEAAETLIFCEHEACATLGRRAKPENILDSKLPTFEIERGGDVTYHGPGQLVIYPLMRLHGANFPLGLHEYLRFCEELIIDYLSELGLEAGRFGPTGVWIKSKKQSLNAAPAVKKIASLGIAVSRWITYHGLALNVNTDLSDFQRIRPCDFEPSIMTSIQQEGIDLTMEDVAQRLEELWFSKSDALVHNLAR